MSTAASLEPKSEVTFVAGSEAFALFVVCNLLATVVAFPVVSIAALLFYGFDDARIWIAIATFAGLHLIVFLAGIWFCRKVACYLVPLVLTTIFVFTFNCHCEGFVDNSPFSDGIGTTPHHRWGVTGYYRVFDQPFRDFGSSYFDLPSVFAGIELSLVLALLIGTSLILLSGIFRRLCQ